MFLQLLVAQLQNQDPLNPTDSTTFVTQLAQFSELEQVMAIRSDTDTLVSDAATEVSNAASSTGSNTGQTSTQQTPGGTVNAMGSAFSTALSALNADTTAIDVVGNNLANLNTTGFKDSNVDFSSLMAEQLGAGSSNGQVGMGVGQVIAVQDFSQGTISSTGGALDAAIQGNGFFVVTTPITTSSTRATAASS